MCAPVHELFAAVRSELELCLRSRVAGVAVPDAWRPFTVLSVPSDMPLDAHLTDAIVVALVRKHFGHADCVHAQGGGDALVDESGCARSRPSAARTI